MQRETTLSLLIDRSAPRGGRNGILIAPARGIGAGTVNEMARSGRGVIACCLDVERASRLALETMRSGVQRVGAPRFLASVEAASCADTGISAADRAETLRVLGDPAASASDLVSPGHIMPCLPPDGQAGVSLVSAALDHVARRTGIAAVAWCDILEDSGEIASIDHCVALAHQLDIEILYAERPGRVAGASLELAECA